MPTETLPRNTFLSANRLRKYSTRGAVIGAVMLAGCGGSSNKKDVSRQPAVQSTATAEALPTPQPVDPIAAGLHKFVKKVNVRHHADIFMGTCIAFGNQSGGITTVLNPGLMDDGTSGKTLVFSANDTSHKPSHYTYLNGPPVGYEGALTLAFIPKHVTGKPFDRVITRKIYHDANGQQYHKDVESGLPVIDTVLTKGPLEPGHVGEICDALRLHTEIPGRKTA